MQILLLCLIVLLTIIICALAGYWFLRPDPHYKRKAGTPQIVPRAGRHDPWTITARPFRNRA